MGYPIKNTQTNLTRELILELYTPNATEWGDLVRRFDEQDRFVEESEAPPSAAQAEDELAAWLGNINLDEEHEHDHHHDHHAHVHGHGHGHRTRRANAPSDSDKGTRGYELYRCSWCGNPSAVLRKCGGCVKTRCVYTCCTSSVGCGGSLNDRTPPSRDDTTGWFYPDTATPGVRSSTGQSTSPTVGARRSEAAAVRFRRPTCQYPVGSLQDGDDDIIPPFASCLFPERLSGRASS